MLELVLRYLNSLSKTLWFPCETHSHQLPLNIILKVKRIRNRVCQRSICSGKGCLKKERIYVYNGVTLLYSRDGHRALKINYMSVKKRRGLQESRPGETLTSVPWLLPTALTKSRPAGPPLQGAVLENGQRDRGLPWWLRQ